MLKKAVGLSSWLIVNENLQNHIKSAVWLKNDFSHWRHSHLRCWKCYLMITITKMWTYLWPSFFGGGIWTQTLYLLGEWSTSWAMPPTLFVLVVLETGSCFLPRPAWTTILLSFMLSLGWQACPAFFCSDGVSQTFCPGCLELRSSWSQSPKKLGLQVWVTSTQCLAIHSKPTHHTAAITM
jgi:hypothetical protein